MEAVAHTPGPWKPRRGLRFDLPLCLGVLILVGIGLVLIYSSSGAYAEARHWEASHFLRQHIKKVIIGFFAFILGLVVPYKTWEKWARPLAIISLVLLVFLVGTGMAGRVHGARRWIQFVGFGLQPSELAKIGLVFYLQTFQLEYSINRHEDMIVLCGDGTGC